MVINTTRIIEERSDGASLNDERRSWRAALEGV
jgi:hypothetical protein